jgi:hypothetical protein
MIDELEQLKKLLWEEWDPIGVNDMAGAVGEYDSYALQIFGMLKRGDSQDNILNHLNFIETELMGLGASASNPKIAERVFEIHRSFK